MQQAMVIGHAISTVKHASLTGWRLLVAQPLGATGQPDTDPVIAVSAIGAGPGEKVIINSDGKGARELIGNEKSPVRWYVVAVVNP